MHRIKNDRGDWVEGKEQIFSAVLDSFEEVYRSDQPAGDDNVFRVIPTLVTPQMNEMLMAQITEANIKDAIFSLGA